MRRLPRHQFAAADELDRLVEARLLTRGEAAEIRHMHEMRHRVVGAGRARAALMSDGGARTPSAEEDDRSQRNYAAIQSAVRRISAEDRSVLRRFVEDFETLQMGTTTGYMLRRLRAALAIVRDLYEPEVD